MQCIVSVRSVHGVVQLVGRILVGTMASLSFHRPASGHAAAAGAGGGFGNVEYDSLPCEVDGALSETLAYMVGHDLL